MELQEEESKISDFYITCNVLKLLYLILQKKESDSKIIIIEEKCAAWHISEQRFKIKCSFSKFKSILEI